MTNPWDDDYFVVTEEALAELARTSVIKVRDAIGEVEVELERLKGVLDQLLI